MSYPGQQSPEEDLDFVTDTAKVALARAGREQGDTVQWLERYCLGLEEVGHSASLLAYHRPLQMWPRCWDVHCTSLQEEPTSGTLFRPIPTQ